jgi:hypothetical protein
MSSTLKISASLELLKKERKERRKKYRKEKQMKE